MWCPYLTVLYCFHLFIYINLFIRLYSFYCSYFLWRDVVFLLFFIDVVHVFVCISLCLFYRCSPFYLCLLILTLFLPFLLSSCFNSPQTRLTCVWFWPLTVYSVTLSSWVSCFFLLVKALCKISFQIKIFINKAYYASWYCKTDLTWL